MAKPLPPPWPQNTCKKKKKKFTNFLKNFLFSSLRFPFIYDKLARNTIHGKVYRAEDATQDELD